MGSYNTLRFLIILTTGFFRASAFLVVFVANKTALSEPKEGYHDDNGRCSKGRPTCRVLALQKSVNMVVRLGMLIAAVTAELGALLN
jgi:hypothetical protein